MRISSLNILSCVGVGRWPLLSWLICFALTTSVLAEDRSSSANDTTAQLDSLPVYYLGDIQVIGKRRNTPTSSNAEIDRAQLATRGVSTVSAALSELPGVVVTAGSKGESRLQIRGFQTYETLVLMDGRPVALPYYGDLDLSSIPFSNISKISVIKGPAGTLFGANAMGGVVNIVSQRATGKPVSDAHMSIGDHNTFDTYANYGAASGKLDWWLSAGRTSTDGYELANDYEPSSLEDGGLRYNSNSRQYNIDGKLNYTVGNNTLVSLSTGMTDMERGLPTGTDRAQYQRYPFWQRWYVDVGADGGWGANMQWKGKVYYDDCENRLQRYGDSIMSDSELVFDSYHDSYDIGAVAGLTADINSRLESTTGLSIRRDGIKRQSDLGEPWVEDHLATLSLSDQVGYRLTHNSRAELGLAYQRISCSRGDVGTDAIDVYGALQYTPRPWLKLHGAASRTTRFPTLSQLYSSPSGNPLLTPEEAGKYELGATFRLGHGLTVSQSVFWSKVDGLIDRKNKNSLYENVDEVSLSGTEIETGWHKALLDISVSYLYLDGYETGVDGIRERRSHTPRQKLTYQVLWRGLRKFEFSHTGQYIHDRVDPDKEAMPQYFLAHARASYAFVSNLRVFLSVRNILDRNYEEERYYPAPGRSIMVGLAFSS